MEPVSEEFPTPLHSPANHSRHQSGRTQSSTHSSYAKDNPCTPQKHQQSDTSRSKEQSFDAVHHLAREAKARACTECLSLTRESYQECQPCSQLFSAS